MVECSFLDEDQVLFESASYWECRRRAREIRARWYADILHSAGQANYSGVRDPAFDDFVDWARRSHAVEERAELYAGACDVLEDLVPAVFLRYSRTV